MFPFIITTLGCSSNSHVNIYFLIKYVSVSFRFVSKRVVECTVHRFIELVEVNLIKVRYFVCHYLIKKLLLSI